MAGAIALSDVRFNIVFTKRSKQILDRFFVEMPRKLKRARTSAINKTARQVKTVAWHYLKAATTIKRRALSKRIQITKKANYNDAMAIVEIVRSKPTIQGFKHKDTTKRVGSEMTGEGVIAEPVRGDSYNIRSGFKPKGKIAFKRTTSSRYPLRPLFGVDPATLVEQTPGVERNMRIDLIVRLEKNLLSQLDRFLKK